MTANARDLSVRTLLEQLKKAVPFHSGLVLTVLPRGELQVAQPSNAPETVTKLYGGGLSTEARLSWQTIIKRKPMRASDAYSKAELEKSPFWQALVEASGVKYGVALPLAAPILDGYPGVVHAYRSAAEGDFTGKDIESMLGVVRQFDAKRQAAGEQARSRDGIADNSSSDAVSFAILDGKLKPLFNGPGLTALDSKLREQLLDLAKRQMQSLGGDGIHATRAEIPDSLGDHWVFRLVSFRKFPAISDGAVTLVCRQPGSVTWSTVKAQDFQADEELSRLIPSLKFMQQEFSKGPTLHDIAKQVHLSPFHFHRRFTELLGLTPKQFLLECQIHQCKGGLLSGDKDLVDIAKECGFAHQSHFTSRFKQTTGLTPTRWRRVMAEQQAAE